VISWYVLLPSLPPSLPPNASSGVGIGMHWKNDENVRLFPFLPPSLPPSLPLSLPPPQAVNVYTTNAFQPLNFLGSVYTAVIKALVDMQNLNQLLSEAPDVVDQPNGKWSWNPSLPPSLPPLLILRTPPLFALFSNNSPTLFPCIPPPSLPPSLPPSSASYSSQGLSLSSGTSLSTTPSRPLLLYSPSLPPSLPPSDSSPRPAPSLLRFLLLPRPLPRVPGRLFPLSRAAACFWLEARFLLCACGHHHSTGKE